MLDTYVVDDFVHSRDTEVFVNHSIGDIPWCVNSCFYEGNSISKLQIQVATYVFELSAGNSHRQIAALCSFVVTYNDRYAHDCTDVAAVTRWRRP
jgi:hypothetical protein